MILSKFSDEQLIQAAQSSSSCKEALTKLGLEKDKKNYPKFKKRLVDAGIDVIPIYKQWKSNFAPIPIKFEIQDILKPNSNYNSSRLKRRLVVEGMLKDECSICGLGSEWNGKPISLQLDHINGINNDHTFSNLRVVCPNCHSQTDNYCSRNIK